MSDPQVLFSPVLHIDTGKTWGGGQQQVLHLHLGLLRRGVVSILVCPRGSALARRVAAESIPAVDMKIGRVFRFPTALRIASLARREGVRTIHMHTSAAHSLGLATARLLKRHINLVVSRRVAFQRKPSLFTKRKYVGQGIRYIAISEAVKKTLLDLSVSERDISIVHSGIDTDRFSKVDEVAARALAEELRIRPGSFVVGSVGSLVPCKGHAVLVKAVAKVAEIIPDVICLIAGDGPERSQLRSLIRRSGLERKVILAGQQDRVPELLSLMNVFVMPSLDEGLGLALLEAMAAAKPVIASSVGGIPEVITAGQNGILVPPGQEGALAESLLDLIRDSARMASLAENARRSVRERFSCEAMVQGTLRVYEDLARGWKGTSC